MSYLLSCSEANVNRDLPDVQAGFRKGRGTRNQIANIHWIIEKAREFQKNIYFCFIDYTKAFDCVDHNKLWKILKEMGIPDHLICLLRNSYAGQEATVRTGHGTTDWFQIGKRKTIALTRQTSVGKVISLLFSMLYRLVITFLPRSKQLLISWLQSPSAVILEPKKIVCHCFHCFPVYFP